MNSRKIERLDSGVLIPGGAQGLQIRDRRAPQPKVGAGIGGWFQLELVDRRGRLTWEHQQHNLFLDSGLDRIGQSSGYLGYMLNAQDISRCAVGVGSADPDVSDTALVSELARTATLVPGAVDEHRRVAAGVYELERSFQFGFDQANGNLTEIGFAWGAGPGNLWMRELIRDPGGNPITLTKTDDFILRAKYTLRFTLSPVTPTAGSFAVAGWGLLNGTFMFRGGGAGPLNNGNTDYRAFREAAAGIGVVGLASSVAASTDYASTQHLGTVSSIRDSSSQVSAFTSGSWQRSVDCTFGVSQSNGVISTIGLHGAGVTNNSNSQPGFFFLVDEEDRQEKDSEHILTIERIIGVTWGRS